MTGLFASVRVLFAKNWRIKQRDSWLNQRRPTTPGAWLFPPLITEVVLPLVVLLYFLRFLCDANPTTVSMEPTAAWSMAMRRLMPQRLPGSLTIPTTSSAVTAMAALPLLLKTANLSLVTLDRPENRAFLEYLDRVYSGDETLGLVRLGSLTKILSVPKDVSIGAADSLLETYPKTSGVGTFMGIDIRRDTPVAPFQARVFFDEDDNNSPEKAQTTDQIAKYFSVDIVEPVKDGRRTFQFPGPLVLQMEMNRFLRQNSTSTASTPTRTTTVSPERACRLVDTMLNVVGLSWQDFPPTSQLGGGEASCEKAIKAGRVGPKTLEFLAQFVDADASRDTLRNVNVNELPKRPRKTVAGQLDGNIVFFTVYMFLWPFNRLVRDVVLEKEKQLKEYLLIMGLQPMALLVSWFLVYLVASVVVAVLAVFMLSGEMFAATQASQLHFFLLLTVFAVSMLLFGLAITPMFSSARTAAVAAPLMYLVLVAAPFVQSYLGDEAVQQSPLLRFVIWFMRQFSAPVVFMEALHNVTALDAVFIKIRPIAWETVAGPSMKMAVQCVGYLVLGWYLESVFPRAFGVQQPWYFLVQPSYWFPNRFGRSKSGDGADDDDELVQLTAVADNESGAAFPQDDTMREMPMADYMDHFRPILLVKGLSKRYPNGKLAVNNVSFGVKKGEIFGLLGPNGAGKSTTMSIICGMLSPTDGDAFVGSKSVAHDPLAIRKSLSVCFQQNILYDELTVWEHLKLVHDLKTSLGIKAIDEEMWIHKLQHFGLEEKRDALSKTLSGGQKRKLSLVLALMDTSRVVLLDEPTAGMDLKARVDTWDALRKAVNHRAVILTTHSMQEAQALCENIGIVAEGKLKCCGSSLFLREKFGVGYKLTVVHPDHDPNSAATAEKVMATVKKQVPSAELVNENKWETRVQLNNDEPATMIPIFEDLEQMKRANVIKRYAVAATDLEDVFVRVTEGEDIYYHVKDGDGSESLRGKMSDKRMDSNSNEQSMTPRHSDIHAIPLQMRALLSKRWKQMVRDKRAFLAHYIWPLVTYVILLTIATGDFGSGSLETLTSLPGTASHTSLFVGTLPGATAVASHIYDHMDSSIKSRVKWEEVATPAQIIDTVMHNDTGTSYFGAVLIRNTTLASPSESVDSPFLQFSIYYNDTIQHSMPVALEWMSVAYCKALGKGTNCELSFTKSAFPRRKSLFTFDVNTGEGSGASSSSPSKDAAQQFLVAFYVLYTVGSISANYITTVVKEKETGLKRLQYLHLASEQASLVYWLSHLVYDYIGYLLSLVVIFIITAAFRLTWPSDLLGAFLAQTLMFGLSTLAFSYLLALAFTSHSSAQSYMSFIALFQEIAAFIVFSLSFVPSLCTKLSTAAMFLRVLPLYAYVEAILNLVTLDMASLRDACVASSTRSASSSPMDFLSDLSTTPSPWAWNIGGRTLTYMGVSFLAYMTILLAVDAMQSYPTILQNRLNWILRRRQSFGVYRPVAHDIESPSRDVIEVQHLTKVYNPKKKSTSSESTGHQDTGSTSEDEDRPQLNSAGQVVAVDDVSFVVERNDCVALLGVNGSGKSTTFEVLTSGIAPTSGNALVDGIDVTLHPQRASRQYGYCPQTNVQFAEMTVREHLEFFYCLRTRRHESPRQKYDVLSNLMAKLDLHQVEHTMAGHLSGGNKRRLMLALSLLTDEVSVLLMDEPSAGVDVVARRLMWKVLYEKRQGNRDVSCLFTTHSMEEAEAVCANAVVLNKGKLVWNGSIPELKQHVAAGISITLRLDTNKVWEPERVRYYVDKIRAVVTRTAGTQFASNDNVMSSSELRNAWRVCHDHHPRTKGQPATNQELEWISALIARIENDSSSGSNPTDTETGATAATVDMTEFVKEWLLREAFATIETQVFQDKISSRSREPVRPVTLHDAMGSGTSSTAVYETNCNADFALVDAFVTLETHKEAFAIARYSISELSLERVFEQFT